MVPLANGDEAMARLMVIGGGLAGCEAAWQAAQRGVAVDLYEMRPQRPTPAHVSDRLAELVCSNSFGSQLPDRASGLLKAELDLLGSLILACAAETALPAGGALAVGREAFADLVTARIESHPLIRVIREEVTDIPTDRPVIVASGPLTSDALANAIARLSGQEHLYFFDAIAPTVAADSIDMTIAFRASRYGRGASEEGDYLNCPLTQEEYDRFVDALLAAETIELRPFEQKMWEDPRFFEGCLPVEVIARRGRQALAFGPMRPVGLIDPRTGRRPYAVVQLRQDDLAGALYNLVGFQTNLKWNEQRRVFSLIPGLEHAEFLRYGMMHRNTFINSPRLLLPTLQWRTRADLFFAGQLTGVEGYMGNAATGLLAGLNAARLIQGQEPLVLPPTTMLGALCHYVTHAAERDFQPMKANFGLLPPLDEPLRNKRARYQAYAARALNDLAAFLRRVGAQQSDLCHITLNHPPIS
jgi:methylenetetrahydrofolate--tRNA-(uracil-5-)-methyltransferase